jgi:hypothetical protein
MPSYRADLVIYRKYDNGNEKIRYVREDGSTPTIYRYSHKSDVAPLELGKPGVYMAQFKIDNGIVTMIGIRRDDDSFQHCEHTRVKNKF